jgi:hypothetical protein
MRLQSHAERALIGNHTGHQGPTQRVQEVRIRYRRQMRDERDDNSRIDRLERNSKNTYIYHTWNSCRTLFCLDQPFLIMNQKNHSLN